MIFCDWCQYWFIIYKEPFCGSKHLKTISYALDHIPGDLYRKDIAEVRPLDLHLLLDTLSDKPNMQNKLKIYLADIFSCAVNNRVVDYSPVLAIRSRVYVPHTTRPMDLATRSKFISSLEGKSYKLLYLMYLFTGARRDELLGDGAFDVDFKNRLVFIHGTKTPGSERVVPLVEPLAKLLCWYDYKAYFRRYKPNYVYLLFKRHCNRVFGVNDYCVRSLRSTFSLMCFEAGIREATISSWLGHTNLQTTFKHYLDNDKIATSLCPAVQNEVSLLNEVVYVCKN